MRISMITWEYPPIMVGGLSVHCKGLAEALVRAGHNVDIITVGYDLLEHENINGVNIYRVKPISHGNFLTWAMFMATALEKKLGNLGIQNYDVVHCHDWMTSFVGANVKSLSKVPYVQSVHSTEVGRCGGINSEDSRAINDSEWFSNYESNQIITVSHAIKNEICSAFNVPFEKVNVIYNGINPYEFNINANDYEKYDFRRHLGILDHEKMILYVGRLAYQKGVEYLIHGFQKLLYGHPDSKLVIAGDGNMQNYLEHISWKLGCRDRVIFLGFKNGDLLKKLYKYADVCVIPSIYEPFGIVALEAMASGTPVVSSDIGGLSEIISHEYNGVKVYPKNPDSIAWGIDKVLSDYGFKEWIVKNAKNDSYTKYSWDTIAKETVQVYKKAIDMMNR
ncbi:glycosyl transferase group 1 [Methanococcus vannielii SB]|jgi:glycosyltransferase involved in cell wall biosynthesis|uniref:Glycosyl transferase group 1 n=1 Tax=Methanococcus vannielii (strain ATCC 35089 / DSM 1224 / JCM 13029 / OCM 148 / SB) TaxID=406327 RepID=A6UPT7_METVS|nr:glycosyltransferase family 4 protein [Methanococcus vannielii]ABR54509.1 glycosyl transferase group 1 [Methanococcus vannielii SB]